MSDVMNLIFEKTICNLTTLGNSNKHEEMRLVRASIETIHIYLLTSISCKMSAKVPLMRQLATSHISQFQILKAPHQMKELSHFYRVLALLWVNEEFISDFTSYLD